TMPLAHFLDLCVPLSARVLEARQRLRYNTVWNLNLGVNRARVSDAHWLYFPEQQYPFYRVGFSSNFNSDNHPAGTSALYIEVARRGGEKVNRPLLENQIIAGLRRCGLLKASDKLLTKLWIPIECGYVVYDFERTPAVETIMAYLKRRGVESVG